LVSEEQLEATGLAKRYTTTFVLAHAHDPPLLIEDVAERLGIKPKTVERHLALVLKKLEDPDSMREIDTERFDPASTHPEETAVAINRLSDPQRNVAKVARELGLSPEMAKNIAESLDRDLLPLKRVIEEVRVEDLTKRFGTLARDAVDAITPEKLAASAARDLAVVAGIATTNYQLLRGLPTSRMEISDRREMNEVMTLIMEEVSRRGFEIDVTPEGVTTVKKTHGTREDRRHQKRLERQAETIDVSASVSI
jgi:predicted transcriptional regulator